MLDAVKEYFDREYKSAKNLVDTKLWCKPTEVVWNATQRCLGVAEFVQVYEKDFEKVEELYEKVRKDLLQLIEREV